MAPIWVSEKVGNFVPLLGFGRLAKMDQGRIFGSGAYLEDILSGSLVSFQGVNCATGRSTRGWGLVSLVIVIEFDLLSQVLIIFRVFGLGRSFSFQRGRIGSKNGGLTTCRLHDLRF